MLPLATSSSLDSGPFLETGSLGILTGRLTWQVAESQVAPGVYLFGSSVTVLEREASCMWCEINSVHELQLKCPVHVAITKSPTDVCLVSCCYSSVCTFESICAAKAMTIHLCASAALPALGPWCNQPTHPNPVAASESLHRTQPLTTPFHVRQCGRDPCMYLSRPFN